MVKGRKPVLQMMQASRLPPKMSQTQSGKADGGQQLAEEVRAWDEAALVECITSAQVDLALQASILRDSEAAVENDGQGEQRRSSRRLSSSGPKRRTSVACM